MLNLELSPIYGWVKHAAIFAVIVMGTFLVARIVKRFLDRHFDGDNEDSGLNVTQFTFLKHLITGLIYFGGFALAVYSVPGWRNLSLSMFASSGIIAVVVGFASQHALANLVSGIFITIFRPFRVGDRVRMMGKDVAGIVEDITLRHTVLRTFESKRIVIPNSLISSEIVENANLIDEKICRFVEFGISYDSDMDLAMKIMREEALAHPDTIDVRDDEQKSKGDPVVVVRVLGFGDSSVNLRAWVWAKDQPTAFVLACDLNERIKKRFDQSGIEIPFPHRTIVHKK